MRSLVLTPRVIELLRERRIATRFGGGERFAAGDRLRFVPEAQIEPYCNIFEGDLLPTRMGAFSYAVSALSPWARIGRYCSIGTGVEFVHSEHPSDWVSSSPFSYSPQSLPGLHWYMEDRGLSGYPLHPGEKFRLGPTEIGNDVWIGQGAMLKAGVKIGDGAIIGARTFVTRDVPAYAVVTGLPGKVRRLRFAEQTIERLLALRWWRFGPDVMQPFDVTEVEGFIGRLEERLAHDPPPELHLEPLTGAEIIAAAKPSA